MKYVMCLVLLASCGTQGPQGIQGPLGFTGSNGTTGPQGIQGVPGQNAPDSQYSISQLVYPCGIDSSAYKEVLLVLANGDVLATFSLTINGQDTRLTIIPDGTYEDSDESGCVFTISTTNTGRYINWNGGSA